MNWAKVDANLKKNMYIIIAFSIVLQMAIKAVLKIFWNWLEFKKADWKSEIKTFFVIEWESLKKKFLPCQTYFRFQKEVPSVSNIGFY